MAEANKIPRTILPSERRQMSAPTPKTILPSQRRQQRPMGGGMVNTSINAGGVKLDNPAAQANIAGRKAAATAAANAAVKKRMDDNRSKAVQKAISETPGNTGLQEIGDTGAPITPENPMSYTAQRYIKLANGDIDLAKKYAELNKQVGSSEKSKIGLQGLIKVLPAILRDIEKIPVSNIRPLGPTAMQGLNYVKGKVDLLPEMTMVDSTLENIATPFARALGDMRVSDTDAKRATVLLRVAAFSGDAKIRASNIDKMFSLLEGIGGVNIRGYIKRRQKQSKQGKMGEKAIEQDAAALAWAVNNTEDARSIPILDKLGISINERFAVPKFDGEESHEEGQ